MRWKRASNFIIAVILSIAFTIVTLLNIIGPLHINDVGAINKLGILSVYSIIYCIISLTLTWSIYFYFKNKPKFLFFILIILGIVIIIAENFMWGYVGS
jgi:hypothetical protein